MGLTLAEKILLNHTDDKKLADFIYPKVDFCFGNDITAPLAVKEFRKAGFTRVAYPDRVGFICDHFTPARDAKAANNVVLLRDFAKEYKIKNFYDIDKCGVEHAFTVERGLVRPGYLMVGADSHTCTGGAIGAFSCGVGSSDLAAAIAEGHLWLKVPSTMKFIYKGKKSKWLTGKDLILHTIGLIGVDGANYRAMEFAGPVIGELSIEDRLAMSNMAIEAGGKTGLCAPDEKTFAYLKAVQGKNYKFDKSMLKLKSDADAKYESVMEIDVTKMEPVVSCPHLPSNTKPVSKLSKVKVDQVVIGSCTNGRISDLRIAANILKSKKLAKDLRCIVLPATYSVFAQAEKEGLLKIFMDAGCVVTSPTCGPCLGGHSGILAKGEVAVATTNRNFVGRMGSPESFVYLASPAVAAATAIKGKISSPEVI